MATLKNQVVSLVKKGAFDEAVALALSAIEQDKTSPEAWNALSHAQEISGDIESALKSASKTVELSDGEPAYLFQRGWLYLLVDSASESLEDMRRVIALGKSLNNDYYAEMSSFLAAESLRRLHRYDDALRQCSNVRDDFTVHVGLPLSKANLVKTCTLALRHTETLAA